MCICASWKSLIEGIVMSKKIHFSLYITTLDESDGRTFTGASGRNVLQTVYSPEFCIGLDNTGDSPKYQLFDREALTNMSNASIVGANLPDMVNFNPRRLSDHGGLYIHKSVIARLDENLQRWKDTDELFNEEYGFGAPAPLQDVVEELVEFAKTHEVIESPYAGVLLWG